jgi:hypothetical protein
MKVLIACALLIGAAQAVDWAKVRPVYRARPTLIKGKWGRMNIIIIILAVFKQIKKVIKITFKN